ncbi:MAG: hypothetical protein AB8F94_25305 [Saprospiraceae bacterium]
MKKTFQLFSVSILLLCLLSLTSCRQEQVNEEFDFETYKKEIQQNQDYIDYMNIGNQLFQQLAGKEIAIFDIHNKLISKGTEISYCNIDIDQIKEFKGAQKLVNGFCELATGFTKMNQYKNLFAKMTEQQLNELFTFTYSTSSPNSNQATTRINCITQFNISVNNTLNICSQAITAGSYTDCVDLGLSIDVQTYDMCCSLGGDGCP